MLGVGLLVAEATHTTWRLRQNDRQCVPVTNPPNTAASMGCRAGAKSIREGSIPVRDQFRLDLADHTKLDTALDEFDHGLQHLLGVPGAVGDDDDR